MRGFAIFSRGALLGAPFLLASCALFAPRYDAALDGNTDSAYQMVAQFAANGEMGSYADKASFAATAPRYADAQALLAVAKMRAQSLPVQGKRAETARSQLTSFIDGCSARLASFAKQHRLFGIPADGETGNPMLASCDQAARAARVLKPGS
jgi:hypothetical protein